VSSSEARKKYMYIIYLILIIFIMRIFFCCCWKNLKLYSFQWTHQSMTNFKTIYLPFGILLIRRFDQIRPNFCLYSDFNFSHWYQIFFFSSTSAFLVLNWISNNSWKTYHVCSKCFFYRNLIKNRKVKQIYQNEHF
jgi:hypothetical protein